VQWPLDRQADSICGGTRVLRSIRSRLWALVIATIIPFTVLIGAGIWIRWWSDQATATTQAISEARLLAAQIDDHIGNLENLLTGLREAVSTDPRDIAANDALLRKVKGELPDFYSHIAIFAPDATNIGTSSDTSAGRPNPKGHKYFEQALTGRELTIGDVVFGKTAGRWLLSVARPIKDASGHVRAVLAVGTLLDHFQDALRIQALPEGTIVTLVNQKGIVIARSVDGARWIGRDASSWPHLAKHFAEKEGSDVGSWSDGGGVGERVTAFTTAHRAPWLVIVGLPKNAVFAMVVFRLAMAATFLIITLVIGFGIAWTFSGRLIRPLRQLGKDASLLASGELGHRSAVRSRDEVGTLADDFNRMAMALERRAREAHTAADELRQAKDTLAAVIDASPVAIVCCDLQRKTMLWNRTAEEMFGYAAEEMIGLPSRLTPPDAAAESNGMFERAASGETIRNLEGKRLRKDGTAVQVRVAAAPMYNLDGTVRGVARAYEDITDSKRAQEQLIRLAHYDPLTGLPNRLSLQKELGRLLAGCRQSPVAIALFDLDGFKDVNDTLGHSTGDQLLIEVCQRFIEVIDEIARVAKVCRLGGDEFVIIVPDCGDPRVIAEIVDLVLQRFKDPFEVNGNVLHLGCSAGIAIAPNDAVQADELIANADLALYQAKSEGGQTYRFFLPALRARAQARRGLGIELRRAYAENEFELFYQPQIRLADNAVVGAEALLRWRHPERGLIMPAAFIDALAESSIAPEVGRWIITTACEQTAAWHGAGLMLKRIGVNLFPAQAHSQDLLKDVEDALRATGLPADALELEITENAALNFEDSSTTLRKVQATGVRLAFDDFGTGYASLNHLTRFPIWRIKIDRSFVNRITNSVEDAAIVRSLIAMAHNLGLRVVAEGVETEAQAAFLLKESCEEAQGYLYAKPLPVAEFAVYLKGRQLAAPAEGLRANGADRSRGSAGDAQKTLTRRKLSRI
jgi:diguanylate cyclase (GGDEF)-like protein/PAS domain S-box-containing protein